jgi:hypothetical protein
MTPPPWVLLLFETDVDEVEGGDSAAALLLLSRRRRRRSRSVSDGSVK